MNPAQHLLDHMKLLAEASDHRIHEWDGGIAIDTGTVAPGNHYIINTGQISQIDMGFIPYFFDSDAPVIWFQGTEITPNLKNQMENINFKPVLNLTGLEYDLMQFKQPEDLHIHMQEVENKADYDQWCQAFAEVWDRDLEETLIFFQGFMEAPDLHPYLAYVDNKIVGGCCLDLSEGNAGFYWDYVLPKYRRKGYGSAMIKWRLNYAKQQGVKMGYVQCLQSSIGIYKDCGFESTQPMSLFKRVV